MLIADEQHAAAPTGGDVDDGLEGADVGHAGFVDDEQGVGVERLEAALDVAEQGVQGAGRDAGAGGELLGGPSRWAGADDPPAGSLIGVADGVEGVGLAGAGRADQHAQRLTRRGEPGHRRGLVGAQRRPHRERRRHRTGIDRLRWCRGG